MRQSAIPAAGREKRSHTALPKERETVEMIDLSAEDSLIVAEAMLRPPKPSVSLAHAFDLHRKMVLGE